MLKISPAFPVTVGIGTIDDSLEFKRCEVVGGNGARVNSFHLFGGVPCQPFVLNAKGKKPVKPVMLALRGQGTIFPRSAEFPEFSCSQLIEKHKRLAFGPSQQV